MAIALTALFNANPSSPGSPYTTSSISPSANSTLVVCVVHNANATAVRVFGAFGYLKQIGNSAAAGTRRMFVFAKRLGASPGSGTVSIQGDSSMGDTIIQVIQVTGTATDDEIVQAVSAGGSTASPFTLPTMAAFQTGSGAVAFFRDYSGATGPVPKTGWTELVESFDLGTHYILSEDRNPQVTWSSGTPSGGAMGWAGEFRADTNEPTPTPIEINILAVGQASGASFSTSSVTPTANSLLCIVLRSAQTGGSGTPGVAGFTGTWTQIDTARTASDRTLNTFYLATGASPGSDTIDVTYGASQLGINYVVFEVTGPVDLVAPIQQAVGLADASSATSISLPSMSAFQTNSVQVDVYTVFSQSLISGGNDTVGISVLQTGVFFRKVPDTTPAASLSQSSTGRLGSSFEVKYAAAGTLYEREADDTLTLADTATGGRIFEEVAGRTVRYFLD